MQTVDAPSYRGLDSTCSHKEIRPEEYLLLEKLLLLSHNDRTAILWKRMERRTKPFTDNGFGKRFFFLYHFISYLTYVSNGSPKKMTLFFEKNIRKGKYLEKENKISRIYQWKDKKQKKLWHKREWLLPIFWLLYPREGEFHPSPDLSHHADHYQPLQSIWR